jgi:hypothetical protein
VCGVEEVVVFISCARLLVLLKAIFMFVPLNMLEISLIWCER